MFSARPTLCRQEDAPRYCGVTTLNPCRCCECPNWERHGCHCPPNNNVTQDDLNQYLAFERRRMARRALDPEWQAIDPIENGRPCIDPGCPPRSFSQCSPRPDPHAFGEAALGCCGEPFDPDHPCCEACAEAHKAPTHEKATSFRDHSCKLSYPYKTLSTIRKQQNLHGVSKSATYSISSDASPSEVYKSACSARKSYVFKTPRENDTHGRFVCMSGRPLVYCTNKYVPSLDAHVQCLPPQFQGHLRTSGHYMCYIDPAAGLRRGLSDQGQTPEIRSAIAYQTKVRNMQKNNDRRLAVLNDLEARLREGGVGFQNTRLPNKEQTLQMLKSPSDILNVDKLGSNKAYLQQERNRALAGSCIRQRAGIGIGDGSHNCQIYSRRVGMGRKARLICPLTNDPEHIRESFLRLQSDSLYPIEPPAFLTAIQIALLSLRHRPTQTMAPSIVAFVYSPLELSMDKDDMANLGRELSSEAIDITLYVFGEHAQANRQLLQYLVDASVAGSNRINATVTHINGTSLYDFVNSYVQTLMLGNMATGYINYDDDEDDIELQLALQLSRQEAEEAARRNQQGSAEHEDAIDEEAPAPPPTDAPSASATFRGADAQPSIFGIEREDRLGPTQNENSIDSDDLARDLDAMDDSDSK